MHCRKPQHFINNEEVVFIETDEDLDRNVAIGVKDVIERKKEGKKIDLPPNMKELDEKFKGIELFHKNLDVIDCKKARQRSGYGTYTASAKEFDRFILAATIPAMKRDLKYYGNTMVMEMCLRKKMSPISQIGLDHFFETLREAMKECPNHRVWLKRFRPDDINFEKTEITYEDMVYILTHIIGVESRELAELFFFHVEGRWYFIRHSLLVRWVFRSQTECRGSYNSQLLRKHTLLDQTFLVGNDPNSPLSDAVIEKHREMTLLVRQKHEEAVDSEEEEYEVVIDSRKRKTPKQVMQSAPSKKKKRNQSVQEGSDDEEDMQRNTDKNNESSGKQVLKSSKKGKNKKGATNGEVVCEENDEQNSAEETDHKIWSDVLKDFIVITRQEVAKYRLNLSGRTAVQLAWQRSFRLMFERTLYNTPVNERLSETLLITRKAQHFNSVYDPNKPNEPTSFALTVGPVSTDYFFEHDFWHGCIGPDCVIKNYEEKFPEILFITQKGNRADQRWHNSPNIPKFLEQIMALAAYPRLCRWWCWNYYTGGTTRNVTTKAPHMHYYMKCSDECCSMAGYIIIPNQVEPGCKVHVIVSMVCMDEDKPPIGICQEVHFTRRNKRKPMSIDEIVTYHKQLTEELKFTGKIIDASPDETLNFLDAPIIAPYDLVDTCLKIKVGDDFEFLPMFMRKDNNSGTEPTPQQITYYDIEDETSYEKMKKAIDDSSQNFKRKQKFTSVTLDELIVEMKSSPTGYEKPIKNPSKRQKRLSKKEMIKNMSDLQLLIPPQYEDIIRNNQKMGYEYYLETTEGSKKTKSNYSLQMHTSKNKGKLKPIVFRKDNGIPTNASEANGIVFDGDTSLKTSNPNNETETTGNANKESEKSKNHLEMDSDVSDNEENKGNSNFQGDSIANRSDINDELGCSTIVRDLSNGRDYTLLTPVVHQFRNDHFSDDPLSPLNTSVDLLSPIPTRKVEIGTNEELNQSNDSDDVSLEQKSDKLKPLSEIISGKFAKIPDDNFLDKDKDGLSQVSLSEKVPVTPSNGLTTVTSAVSCAGQMNIEGEIEQVEKDGSSSRHKANVIIAKVTKNQQDGRKNEKSVPMSEFSKTNGSTECNNDEQVEANLDAAEKSMISSGETELNQESKVDRGSSSSSKGTNFMTGVIDESSSDVEMDENESLWFPVEQDGNITIDSVRSLFLYDSPIIEDAVQLEKVSLDEVSMSDCQLETEFLAWSNHCNPAGVKVVSRIMKSSKVVVYTNGLNTCNLGKANLSKNLRSLKDAEKEFDKKQQNCTVSEPLVNCDLRSGVAMKNVITQRCGSKAKLNALGWSKPKKYDKKCKPKKVRQNEISRFLRSRPSEKDTNLIDIGISVEEEENDERFTINGKSCMSMIRQGSGEVMTNSRKHKLPLEANERHFSVRADKKTLTIGSQENVEDTRFVEYTFPVFLNEEGYQMFLALASDLNKLPYGCAPRNPGIDNNHFHTYSLVERMDFCQRLVDVTMIIECNRKGQIKKSLTRFTEGIDWRRTFYDETLGLPEFCMEVIKGNVLNLKNKTCGLKVSKYISQCDYSVVGGFENDDLILDVWCENGTDYSVITNLEAPKGDPKTLYLFLYQFHIKTFYLTENFKNFICSTLKPQYPIETIVIIPKFASEVNEDDWHSAGYYCLPYLASATTGHTCLRLIISPDKQWKSRELRHIALDCFLSGKLDAAMKCKLVTIRDGAPESGSCRYLKSTDTTVYYDKKIVLTPCCFSNCRLPLYMYRNTKSVIKCQNCKVYYHCACLSGLYFDCQYKNIFCPTNRSQICPIRDSDYFICCVCLENQNFGFGVFEQLSDFNFRAALDWLIFKNNLHKSVTIRELYQYLEMMEKIDDDKAEIESTLFFDRYIDLINGSENKEQEQFSGVSCLNCDSLNFLFQNNGLVVDNMDTKIYENICSRIDSIFSGRDFVIMVPCVQNRMFFVICYKNTGKVLLFDPLLRLKHNQELMNEELQLASAVCTTITGLMNCYQTQFKPESASDIKWEGFVSNHAPFCRSKLQTMAICAGMLYQLAGGFNFHYLNLLTVPYWFSFILRTVLCDKVYPDVKQSEYPKNSEEKCQLKTRSFGIIRSPPVCFDSVTDIKVQSYQNV